MIDKGEQITRQLFNVLEIIWQVDLPIAVVGEGRVGVNLTHFILNLGNAAPTAGLERDVGQQAANCGRLGSKLDCPLGAVHRIERRN